MYRTSIIYIGGVFFCEASLKTKQTHATWVGFTKGKKRKEK